MRVFMCTAGTLGFCGWAMSEMPEAQNCGCSSAPGICLRNSGANSPMHGRGVHADLLEHAAVHHAHDAAAARRAGMIGPLPRRALEAPRGTVRQRGARRQIVLELLEGGADAVAQLARTRRAPPPCARRVRSASRVGSVTSAMPARFLEPFCWRNSPYISPAAMSRGASPAGTPKTRKNITICARLARPGAVCAAQLCRRLRGAWSPS